jgi:ribonuclease HI
MKVNVDAALSNTSSTGAAAVVARDENGMFLGASAVVFSSVLDAEQLEALACLEALAFTADLDLRRFRVASNFLNVVKNIHGVGMRSYGQIINEIKARMEDFTSDDIVHTGRESNVHAHILSRHCIYESVGHLVWFLSLPDGICNSLGGINKTVGVDHKKKADTTHCTVLLPQQVSRGVSLVLLLHFCAYCELLSNVYYRLNQLKKLV